MNSTNPSIAPLRNVAAFAALVERVTNRRTNLPGMAVFYGKSGLGKTMSATYGANKHRAHVVQVNSVWTKKRLCHAILQEMGLKPVPTVAEMVDQIGEQLALSGRPLIVDDAQFLVHRGMIEILRDIYESSFAAVILIGEESLPTDLKRWERVHNRMLDWVQAQPCDLADVRHLARIYCPGVDVADELLERVRTAVNGCTRRIAVNLDHIWVFAEGKALAALDSSIYKGRIDTGDAGRGA